MTRMGKRGLVSRREVLWGVQVRAWDWEAVGGAPLALEATGVAGPEVKGEIEGEEPGMVEDGRWLWKAVTKEAWAGDG